MSALLRWICAPVLLSLSLTGMAADAEYNYPFDDPLVATEQALDNNNWAATARQLSVDVGNLHRLAKRLGLK